MYAHGKSISGEMAFPILFFIVLENMAKGGTMNRTIQREAILNELRRMHSHPTADELYGILRPKVPQLSLGTVYRNLEEMARRGLIRKLELTGRQKRFDGVASEHHHLRCRHCDGVFNFEHPDLQKVDDLLANLLPGLDCDGIYLEWNGSCPDCRSRRAAEEANTHEEEHHERKNANLPVSALRAGR